MAFRTQDGVGEPRDLFYPNVLTPTKVPTLNPKSVQDAFRRIFDMVYGIQPPPGSRSASTIFSTPNFAGNATVKLDNKIVVLAGQEWEGSASGAVWNAHTLTYNGVAYPISAGGPTTNKYIYWSLNDSGNYQSSATFPTLGIDDFLIAVYNSSDTTVYEFWNAKLAPAFISTALIEDLAVTDAKIDTLTATKITAGNITVTLTLTSGLIRTADSGARIELDATSFRAYDSTGSVWTTIPAGTGTPLRTNKLATMANFTGAFDVYNDNSGGIPRSTRILSRAPGSGAQFVSVDDDTAQIVLGINNGTQTCVFTATDLTLSAGSYRVTTDGQGVGTTNNGFSFYETGDKTEGYANGVLSFKFDSTSHATNTNLYIYHNGSLKQVTVDGSNFLKV